MRVGWIGLGKLGLPCALALEQHGGHEVVGYDPAPWPRRVLAGEEPPPPEDGITELLAGTALKLVDTAGEVVAATDGVVFVAVQTPHPPGYGGEQPMPAAPADFDYTYLVAAVDQVARAAAEQAKPVTIAVISTVLPGTCDRELRPLLGEYVTLVYNPFFIALGNTIRDFLRPEFVLAGADRCEDADPLLTLYATLHERQVLVVRGFRTAELIKVAYNTFMSLKIVFANSVMQVAHELGANCDTVTTALTMATDRITSAACLRGGMADGGPCRPRDNVAMSWLARELGLDADPFTYIADAREAHTSWIADEVDQWATTKRLSVVVLGKAFKPGTHLTVGSPALLLTHILQERGLEVALYDPHLDGPTAGVTARKAVYVIATDHETFRQLVFPAGSVVIDPHGHIPYQNDVTVIRLGRDR